MHLFLFYLFVKSTISGKSNKVRHRKMRYAYTEMQTKTQPAPERNKFFPTWEKVRNHPSYFNTAASQPFLSFLLPKFQLFCSLGQAFTNHGSFFSESWADFLGTHSHSLKILASSALFLCQPLFQSSFLVTWVSVWIIQLSTQGPCPSGPWPPYLCKSILLSHLISQHVYMNTL